MGSILEFYKGAFDMSVSEMPQELIDPFSKSKEPDTYLYDLDLPFMKGMSSDLQKMIC